jgi:hypothetical protein
MGLMQTSSLQLEEKQKNLKLNEPYFKFRKQKAVNNKKQFDEEGNDVS